VNGKRSLRLTSLSAAVAAAATASTIATATATSTVATTSAAATAAASAVRSLVDADPATVEPKKVSNEFAQCRIVGARAVRVCSAAEAPPRPSTRKWR
jgi:hypothetical protein